jgi:hypothetical protein
VTRLRNYLNAEQSHGQYDGETSMFDEADGEPAPGGNDDIDVDPNPILLNGAPMPPPAMMQLFSTAFPNAQQGPANNTNVNVNGLMGAMGATAIDEDEDLGEGSEIMNAD